MTSLCSEEQKLLYRNTIDGVQPEQIWTTGESGRHPVNRLRACMELDDAGLLHSSEHVVQFQMDTACIGGRDAQGQHRAISANRVRCEFEEGEFLWVRDQLDIDERGHLEIVSRLYTKRIVNVCVIDVEMVKSVGETQSFNLFNGWLIQR